MVEPISTLKANSTDHLAVYTSYRLDVLIQNTVTPTLLTAHLISILDLCPAMTERRWGRKDGMKRLMSM